MSDPTPKIAAGRRAAKDDNPDRIKHEFLRQEIQWSTAGARLRPMNHLRDRAMICPYQLMQFVKP